MGDQRQYGLVTGSIWNYEDTMPSNSLSSTIKESPRDEANIEAERGETIVGDLDGDGNLEHAKIGGKRHYQGGTPLNVPDGSFIFSDTSKMKIANTDILKNIFGVNTKKPVTPATIAKKYELNKYKNILEDPESDPMSKKTAQMMIDNNLKKLGQLALIQEGMKGFPDGIPSIAMPLFGSDMSQGGGQAEGMQTARYGGLQKAQPGKQIGKATSFNTTGNYTSAEEERVKAIAKAAEEKKKAEIAANIARAKREADNAIKAKMTQYSGLQDISKYLTLNHPSNYLEIMNRYARFRDNYVKEVQAAIKNNQVFKPSQKLIDEAANIKTDVEGPHGEIIGSVKLPSLNPLNAWDQFTIAGGSEQGEIDDMSDVVQNMISKEGASSFVQRFFPAAAKQQLKLKVDKSINTYEKNKTLFINELQKHINQHQKLLSEGKESPYKESDIQTAYKTIEDLKKFSETQAKNTFTGYGVENPGGTKDLMILWENNRRNDPKFANDQLQALNSYITNTGLQATDKNGFIILNPNRFPPITSSGTNVKVEEKKPDSNVPSTGGAKLENIQIGSGDQSNTGKGETIVVDPNKASEKERKKKEDKSKQNTTINTNDNYGQSIQDSLMNVLQGQHEYGGNVGLQRFDNGGPFSQLNKQTFIKDTDQYTVVQPSKFLKDSFGTQGYDSNLGYYTVKNKNTGQLEELPIDDFITRQSDVLKDYTGGINAWKQEATSKDKATREKAVEWFQKQYNEWRKANGLSEYFIGSGVDNPYGIDKKLGIYTWSAPGIKKKDSVQKKTDVVTTTDETKTKTKVGDVPNVVYEQGYEKAPWFRQDIANYYSALRNAADINKGPMPILQQLNSPLVDAALLDPARQIAALQSNLNTTQAGIRSGQDTPQAVANMIAASATSAPNIANIIADYENKNVGIANQRDQLNNQIIRSDMATNARALKGFYDEMTTREQQYQNAAADAANKIIKAYMQGETNRDIATSANVEHPNHSFDPLTGMYYFKRGYDPKTGAPIDEQMSISELYDLYMQKPGMTPDLAIELITGTRSKSKTPTKEEGAASKYGSEVYNYNPVDFLWNQ